MDVRLDGRSAVITGGSKGLGLAMAQKLASSGADVAILARNQGGIDEAVAVIKRNVTTVVGDVSRLGDLDRLYAVVKEKHGYIDILFANAGAGTIGPLARADSVLTRRAEVHQPRYIATRGFDSKRRFNLRNGCSSRLQDRAAPP